MCRCHPDFVSVPVAGLPMRTNSGRIVCADAQVPAKLVKPVPVKSANTLFSRVWLSEVATINLLRIGADDTALAEPLAA